MTVLGDVRIERTGHVALVEMCRPPHNFFDAELIGNLADAFELLDAEVECRAIVLASEGKSFCAGADFSNPIRIFTADGEANAKLIYSQAGRLFAAKKPVIGAIQGAAIGGGLGVALVPDFRIASPDARFSANFSQLGVHPGFGLTHTLPRLVGEQKAALMFYTGRRVKGEEALAMGLIDQLVPAEQLRASAFALAEEIAAAAPLAVQSVRETLRMGLSEAVLKQTEREFDEQFWLAQTADHEEGIRAVGERRAGRFTGLR